MSVVVLKAIGILALPFVVFRGGAWIMLKLTNRQYVTDRLIRETDRDDRKPLNRRFGYDIRAVNRHWGALNDTARGIELRFLHLDLLFPIFYGTSLAISLLMAWEMLGQPFHVGWILMPVVIAVIADWTENLVQIGQLRQHQRKDETTLEASWIQIASTATVLKLLFLIGSSVLLFVLLGVLLSGCATTKEFSHLPMAKDKTRINAKDADYETTLQFQFYGTAGGMLSLGNEGLLMDPFVSNPSIPSLIFGKKLTANDRLINNKTFTNLDIVKGIIVGHGHYDHLMDVPAVMDLDEMPEKVNVYADQVSAYQLNNFESTKGNIVVVDGNIDRPYDKSTWYSLPGGNIKIYPVRSDHAPNVWRFRVPFGTRNEPMGNKDVPRTFYDWKAGAFLNYAVVITHPVSKVCYRIYIQSSASDGSIGLPPKGMMEDIGGFDLLILSAASYDKVYQYPSLLLAFTKPDDVILVHWDDFFEQDDDIEKDPKAAPGVNLDELLEKIWFVDSSINVSIPTPNSIVKISKRE